MSYIFQALSFVQEILLSSYFHQILSSLNNGCSFFDFSCPLHCLLYLSSDTFKLREDPHYGYLTQSQKIELRYSANLLILPINTDTSASDPVVNKCYFPGLDCILINQRPGAEVITLSHLQLVGLSRTIKCFSVTECRHNHQLSKLPCVKIKEGINASNSFKHINNEKK